MKRLKSQDLIWESFRSSIEPVRLYTFWFWWCRLVEKQHSGEQYSADWDLAPRSTCAVWMQKNSTKMERTLEIGRT